MDSVTLEIPASFDQYRKPLCYLLHRKTLLCRTINPVWNSLCWKKRKSAWWKTKASQKPSEDSWQQWKQRCGCSISVQGKGLSGGQRRGETNMLEKWFYQMYSSYVSEQNEKSQLRGTRPLCTPSEVFQTVSKLQWIPLPIRVDIHGFRFLFTFP